MDQGRWLWQFAAPNRGYLTIRKLKYVCRATGLPNNGISTIEDQIVRMTYTETRQAPRFICNYCEHMKIKCKPEPINASTVAVNLSTGRFSFAFNSSRERRQMRAWPVSNASRYNYSTQPAVENYACVVKIDDGKILVEYKIEYDTVQYVGEEKGQGHFELVCPARYGKASLHMFPDAVILEGSWIEGSDRGMWRIRLENA